MDPISLDKLLSIADAIAVQHNREFSFSDLQQIIASQSNAKDLERRTRDILRVLRELNWLVPGEGTKLRTTVRFTDFISAWNEGDFHALNDSLVAYWSYSQFLSCLRAERDIRIPNRQDKNALKILGKWLHDRYAITFVAFDTFRAWAMAVGQVYLSPFNETLYWGGEWDEECPSQEVFKRTCWEAYRQVDQSSGYANIGHVADNVCRALHISFQAFEVKMSTLVKTEPGLVRLAPATIRRELSRFFQITTLRPRSEVLKERLLAELREEAAPKPQWLERRYLEDGIHMAGQRLKLLRWEATT